MNNIIIHTVESAPEASKPALRGALKNFGFIPNLLGVLADAPAALGAYLAVAGAFSKSSLDASEQQIVLISTSIENDCEYCVAAHTYLARAGGVPDRLLQGLRAGQPLDDAKLNALATFTRALVHDRGYVSSAQVNAFREAGYTSAQVQEVIVGVTQKTLSNYSNHLTNLPLDSQFAADAWSPAAAAE